MDNGRKYTDLDPSQVARLAFDVQNEANRVVIVGGGDVKLEVDTDGMLKAIENGLSNVKITQESVQSPITKTEIVRIEVPVIVKETVIERIEVPVVTSEVKIVEVPVIVEKVINHVVEKPIVIEKVIERIPKYIHYIMGLEALIILVLSIMLRSN